MPAVTPNAFSHPDEAVDVARAWVDAITDSSVSQAVVLEQLEAYSPQLRMHTEMDFTIPPPPSKDVSSFRVRLRIYPTFIKMNASRRFVTSIADSWPALSDHHFPLYESVTRALGSVTSTAQPCPDDGRCHQWRWTYMPIAVSLAYDHAMQNQSLAVRFDYRKVTPR